MRSTIFAVRSWTSSWVFRPTCASIPATRRRRRSAGSGSRTPSSACGGAPAPEGARGGLWGEGEHTPFVRVWRGLDPEGDEGCYVGGAEATLIAWSPDYDGEGKGWVRFA